MRTLFLLLIFLQLSITLPAQYVVINVKESVYADEKPLKKKDKLGDNTKLRFSSANAFAYVMSPGKGYFILGVKERKKGQGEFMLALKDALLPPNEFYAASTRSYELYENMIFEDEYDIKAFFRNDLFFIAPAKFEVSAQHFPMDSAHYFMIRHQLADGWMGKPLPYEGHVFEINNKIFQLQDKVFTENMIQYSELYYMNHETGEEQYLGRFKLQFPSPNSVKEELTALYTAIGNMPTEEFFREHAMPYLNVQYGKTQLDTVSQIIRQISKK